MNRKTFPKSLQRARGVTLIELMIALVLGLLVVAAAIGIFLSNKQVFRTSDNLSRMQENARIGFELMARDLRMAGASACSREIPIRSEEHTSELQSLMRITYAVFCL